MNTGLIFLFCLISFSCLQAAEKTTLQAAPQRRNMGDFQRHNVKVLHDISFMDGKKLYGKIIISASVHYSESWEHLKDTDLGDGRSAAAPPAGPHNRRIIESIGGISVTSFGSTSEKAPSKEVQIIADEIKVNNGLILIEQDGKTKKVVSVQDSNFEAVFRDRMKSNKYVIDFRK